MNPRAHIPHRRLVGCCAGSLVAAAVLTAPPALATPDQCSAEGVSGTVSSVTASARQYLTDHPGAGQVLSAAAGQPQPVAEASVRNYFTANPGEYFALRAILAPIGDTQRVCNVSLLPPQLSSAYDQFMAG